MPAWLASIVCGLAVSTVHAKDAPLLSLSMAHFRDTAAVHSDPGAGTITISTEKGFMEHTGPMRMVWSDEFLRGIIDRRTGQKSFEVTAWLIYSGRPRSYATARFQTPTGMRSVPTTQLAREVSTCAVGECSYTDHIAFSVDEELLRQLAAEPDEPKPRIWHYTLIAKAAPEYGGGLSTAEVAGLLAKVDEISSAPPAAPASAATVAAAASVAASAAASAPFESDFGIGGMPVEASEEQPNRAGLLVVGVKHGSIAQKSGIIVGDILYEFDGRALKLLPDLEAAIAGCAADSVVTIKLYRGTGAMAVTAHF
jgi:hypothetical protein